MKKICLLTTGVLLIASTAFAAPQTDIEQGKTALDVGVFSSKTAISGDDLDKKANLDLGITTGLSNKYAIQYKYHVLDSDTTDGYNVDANTQEFNVLYKMTPNTNAFVGINRISGSLESFDMDSKNKLQVGITTKVPLSEKFSAWGTVAAGSDLVTCEAGISHTLSQNADLNVYYRYTKNDDLRIAGNKFDFENNGFGLGVTMNF